MEGASEVLRLQVLKRNCLGLIPLERVSRWERIWLVECNQIKTLPKRDRLSQFRERGLHKFCTDDHWGGNFGISCSSSGGRRGFGPEPSKKEKANRYNISGEDSGRTPQQRSALEKVKEEEEKQYRAIDYDGPVESEKTTIGLGTKVGVGVAVLAFGLVFALGDFFPSVSTNNDTVVEEKNLSKEEKDALQARLQKFEAMLASLPKDAEALEGAAVTLAELGEYGRASSLLEKLIKERPAYVDAYRLLGEVKFELKEFEGSASAYRLAASITEKTDLEILRRLTNALLAAKKPDEAVQLLLAARDRINIDTLIPNKRDIPADEQDLPIQVELLLGKAYSDWDHISDAVAVYDRLISIFPDDFRGYLAKGIILKENGKVGDAERMFIQARFLAPEKAKAVVDRYSR
ncbi:uncharacterized protein LOC18437189 isoform X6 [Amborella trichopoda]|uniref:uncharacterized protein LOC18437189 isoform X6 n=1 Tax=Amborella trichopoda TaxID=13333 RepID=UPI0009BFEE3D|nr:uncharacterized protein LOC18437189 isoform X6 [Amborella trichopoda]|eukprot:XP_020524703.1 uncharacterized protein LOC18437189 isoform X6 [Amborella trichopoda]